MVKNPPAIAGDMVQSLVQEGPTRQGVRGSMLTETAHLGQAPGNHLHQILYDRRA